MALDEADLKAIQELLDARVGTALGPVADRLNKQSAIIEGLRKAKPDADPKPGSGDPPGTAERLRKIEQDQKALLDRETRLNRRAMALAIARALKRYGVPEQLAGDAADVILSREGDRWALSDDGDQATRREAPDADPVSAEDWAKGWTATDHGRAYLPTKPAPQFHRPQSPGKPGGAARQRFTRDDLAKGRIPAGIDMRTVEIVED